MSTPVVIALLFVVVVFVILLNGAEASEPKVSTMNNAILLSFLFIAVATFSARADIRAELDTLLSEDPITESSVVRLCDLGDSTSRQNLQQLCYKTACAGFAYLGATNLYEETMAKVITKSFAESFQAQCPRCRGLGVAKVICPDCNGKRCPNCEETGSIKSRCPDCDGKAAVFSSDLALSAYRRGLTALKKAIDPQAEPPASPAPLVPTRLTDDQFFARHCLDLAAYAIFTNRESTTIHRNEAFQKIATRAYVPRGFSSAVLLYRYPNGESFEVTDVSTREDVFHVVLRKENDPRPKTLIIPQSESDISFWKKRRSVISRGWVFAATAYVPVAPSSASLTTSSSTFYRTLAEFRRLHPGAEDVESP